LVTRLFKDADELPGLFKTTCADAPGTGASQMRWAV
jgi:hypothetical protein